jgi:RimJ/RimL family protein N-acetyltransferase
VPEIRLEPLSERHVPDVATIVDDPAVLRFTRLPDPPPEGFAAEWVRRYEEGRREGTREGFAVYDGDGTFLGVALAPAIDAEGRELELGYIVAAPARGRGVAIEMLRRLTDWAFDEQGALRIQLDIDPGNAPSLRVAERCGYVREGLLRSTHLKQGRRVDTVVWSRLPSDPAPEAGGAGTVAA